MRHIGVLLLGIVVAAPTSYAGDTLKEYAAKCEEATGVKVPDFSCDDGTEVPDTNPTSSPKDYNPKALKCDRPNHLNHECDPGSRFQVLLEDANAYVVAHCRKQGHDPGKYGDIAVIQHNKNNGATCFYQALDEDTPDGPDGKKVGLDGIKVIKPSFGTSLAGDAGAWPWKRPAKTAGIGCGACHDNGPLIRSPYLSQVTGKDGKRLLPGAMEPYAFNSSGMPYYFVGSDFADWKAYEVEVKKMGKKDKVASECLSCHRLGVNNVPINGTLGPNGTARDFGLRATAKDQGLVKGFRDGTPPFKPKNDLNADSPMWMVPDDLSDHPDRPGKPHESKPPNGEHMEKYSQAHADAAQEIKDCADKVRFKQPPPVPGESGEKPGLLDDPVPNKDACRIGQFAGRWKLAAVRWSDAMAYLFKGHRVSVFKAKPEGSKAGDPNPIDIQDLWMGGIDAAMLWGKGKAYIFMGDQYVRYDVKANKVDKGYPRSIAGHWAGVWADGVDAAVPWNNGKVYFFRGTQYIQYDVKADKSDTGYPKPITDGWPGVWPDGIDAAIQWDENTAYFFKGDQYMRYNVKANTVDPGYPTPIKGNWPYVDWAAPTKTSTP